MDKKSKILFIIIIVSIIISIGVTFYKTVIIKDFKTIESEPMTSESE